MGSVNKPQGNRYSGSRSRGNHQLRIMNILKEEKGVVVFSVDYRLGHHKNAQKRV